MNLYTHRRKRRREKAKLSNVKSVRRHARKSGRTGAIHSKREVSKKSVPYVNTFVVLGYKLPDFFIVRWPLSSEGVHRG